jgi:hypothetical protein
MISHFADKSSLSINLGLLLKYKYGDYYQFKKPLFSLTLLVNNMFITTPGMFVTTNVARHDLKPFVVNLKL